MKLFLNDPAKKSSVTQESVTQGMSFLNIHNMYPESIFLFYDGRYNELKPGNMLRYRGYYSMGIPFGEVLLTDKESVIIDKFATDLFLGNF